MSTICDLPELGTVVTLLTHHHIRDDANLLFGFLTTTERVIQDLSKLMLVIEWRLPFYLCFC